MADSTGSTTCRPPGRSSRYFQTLPPGKRPEWSGIAHGCALPDRDPNRNRLHDIDRQFGQLRQAGIAGREPADLSWSHGDISAFGLPRTFALLAPGSSPHRLLKRWPVAGYRELAVALSARGVAPVVIGTAPEQPLAAAALEGVRGGIDLTGQHGLSSTRSLARAATVAVGNDTGPMHLIASAGCPAIVLFSREFRTCALCAARTISCSGPGSTGGRGAYVLPAQSPMCAGDARSPADAIIRPPGSNRGSHH